MGNTNSSVHPAPVIQARRILVHPNAGLQEIPKRRQDRKLMIVIVPRVLPPRDTIYPYIISVDATTNDANFLIKRTQNGDIRIYYTTNMCTVKAFAGFNEEILNMLSGTCRFNKENVLKIVITVSKYEENNRTKKTFSYAARWENFYF